MNITIHRGCQEIGGSCIEVSHEGTRLILDLGMPLVEPRDKTKKLDSRALGAKTRAELADRGILPTVPGLYKGDPRGVDAILLTHAHQDHYGLLGHIHPEIPVYLSDGARRVIEVADIFLPLKAGLRDPRPVEHGRPFKIGPFTITPHLMDHSAFAAMAFLIEAGGKRVFYTGDFRGHGRKGAIFSKLLRRPPQNVDWLLMEGTTLGGRHEIKTERQVEEDILGIAQAHPGPKLAYVSGQNVDRLVSFYRAALRMNGQLVLDLYTAFLLDHLGHPSIPSPCRGFKGVKVLFSKPLMKSLLRAGRHEVIRRFRPHEISPETLKRQLGRSVIVFRESVRRELEAAGPLKDGVMIYSQYAGYLEEASFSKTRAFLNGHGLALEKAHTSGHASAEDLRRLVQAVAPKALVPIHTFHPEAFCALWPNVLRLEDGQTREV